jgi:hypothetical protein
MGRALDLSHTELTEITEKFFTLKYFEDSEDSRERSERA